MNTYVIRIYNSKLTCKENERAMQSLLHRYIARLNPDIYYFTLAVL